MPKKKQPQLQVKIEYVGKNGMEDAAMTLLRAIMQQEEEKIKKEVVKCKVS